MCNVCVCECVAVPLCAQADQLPAACAHGPSASAACHLLLHCASRPRLSAPQADAAPCAVRPLRCECGAASGPHALSHHSRAADDACGVHGAAAACGSPCTSCYRQQASVPVCLGPCNDACVIAWGTRFSCFYNVCMYGCLRLCCELLSACDMCLPLYRLCVCVCVYVCSTADADIMAFYQAREAMLRRGGLK